MVAPCWQGMEEHGLTSRLGQTSALSRALPSGTNYGSRGHHLDIVLPCSPTQLRGGLVQLAGPRLIRESRTEWGVAVAAVATRVLHYEGRTDRERASTGRSDAGMFSLQIRDKREVWLGRSSTPVYRFVPDPRIRSVPHEAAACRPGAHSPAPHGRSAPIRLNHAALYLSGTKRSGYRWTSRSAPRAARPPYRLREAQVRPCLHRKSDRPRPRARSAAPAGIRPAGRRRAGRRC
jgi:hypothetical protein